MDSNDASSHTKDMQNRKLYVSNLPKNNQVTEDMIQQFFERFGPVDRVLMVNDSKLNKFRGFCYVIMKRQKDFDYIMNLEDTINFYGNELDIKNSKTIQEVESTRVFKKNLNIFISDKSESSENGRENKISLLDAIASKPRRHSGHSGNNNKTPLSNSKQHIFSKQKSMDQETGENTLSPQLSPIFDQQSPINFVYYGQQPQELNSNPSSYSGSGSESFVPS